MEETKEKVLYLQNQIIENQPLIEKAKIENTVLKEKLNIENSVAKEKEAACSTEAEEIR